MDTFGAIGPNIGQNIGLFDSGFGGLTILKAVQQALPQQNFIYYADHANAPYGNKPEEEIVNLTKQACEKLFNKGCSLVILACNTASALACRDLQQNWLPKHYPNHRILSVVVPVVEAVTGLPWAHKHAGARKTETGSLAVFATRRTVESNAYRIEVKKRAPQQTIHQIPCPHLAGAIEDGAPESELKVLINEYVSNLCTLTNHCAPTWVALGCTHYPLAEHLFRQALPATTKILNQPQLVATATAHYLQTHSQFASFNPQGGQITLLTSGQNISNLNLLLPRYQPNTTTQFQVA